MSLSDQIQGLQGREHHLALPFHGDAPFELLWASEQDFAAFPELEDVEEELSEYLLLAIARRTDALLPILVSKAQPHPTFVFFEGFHQLDASLDAFSKRLSRVGEVDPTALLRAGLDEASGLLDGGRYAEGAEKLASLLEPYRARAAADGPLDALLARGFTDLGFARHELGDDGEAMRAYELGAKHGSYAAGKNLLTMHRDAGDWVRAKERAETLLARFSNPDDLNEIRIGYALALASLGDAVALEKLGTEHVDYLKWLSKREVEKATSLRDGFVAQLEAARADAIAPAMLEPLVTTLTQLSLIGKSKVPSERDVARVLEAIQRQQDSKFRTWLQSKPALAEEPRVVEAVDALAEPAASVFRAILSERRTH